MVTTTTGLATSFITFTRTSNATVTDSNGFIEWAGHNLLTNSESFDASAWVKSSATVTANTDPAPNGTTTGDTIAASGANGTALQTWTAEAVPYTFGVWLRRKTGTGNIQIAADSGTYTTVTITSSWALYTVTQTPAAGSKSAGIRIVTSGDEVYAWGAHLYRSDLGGMVLNPARGDAYYPTTPRNMIGYTEDFSNAYWTANRSSVTANAALAPNGLQTADLLKDDTTASNTHRVYITTPFTINSGTRYTQSVYVKAAGRTQCFLRVPGETTDDNGARFDLTAVTATAVGTIVSAAITAMGDGWYRCLLVADAISASYRFYVGMAVAGSLSYTGDGTSGIYLWGAQLSDSASLDAYSPVYGAAVTSAAYYAPRLDYDPVTLAARGLLVEEQRTNLLSYSAAFNNAWWTPNALNSVNVSSGVSPDGTNSAVKIIENTATSFHGIYRSSISVVSGVTYTLSCYFKAAERSFAIIGFTEGADYAAIANVSTGVVTFTGTGVTATINSVGNGWYRFSMTRTVGTSVMNVFLGGSNSGTSTSYAGDGTSGILMWGAQFEVGASNASAPFVTSLIPTNGATATRTADVASVSTQAFPYSATEGTLVFAGSVNGTPGAATVDFLQLSNGVSNSIAIDLGMFDVSAPLFQVTNTTTQVSLDLGSMTVGSVVKMAGAYKANDFAGVLNGGTVQTDVSGSVPSGIVTLGIGSRLGGVYMNGHIRQITYLPRRISNTELQTRTA